MADLILTKDEQNASDLMDWDDVALANAIRFLEHNFWTTKGGDTSVFSYTSAGTLLITAMLKSNATELNLDVKGVSIKGEPYGDFQIQIQKIPESEDDTLPVPDNIDQNRRQLEFSIAGCVPAWPERLLTAWEMIRAAALTLCAGKFSLLIRKEYKIHRLSQSGHNI